MGTKEAKNSQESNSSGIKDIWLEMMRPPFEIFNFKPKGRRFFSFSPHGGRNEMVTGDVKKLLNTYLTVDPITGKRIELEKEEIFRQNNARHLREYAESTAELVADQNDVALAWLERLRATATWMDSTDFKKARGRSVFFSFAGIFVSTSGLYPSNVESLGIQFSRTSHIAFIFALLGVVWYQWASVRVLYRDYLINITLLELEHKVKGIYKNYDNRWQKYIYWQYSEKAFFYGRIVSWIAYISAICLVVSAVHTR